ncbi:MAG: hypothetical protein KCHDKBKB_01070 [Elusimicrobia bacterium]|nr:hypothetical protein [Elusimicrobiota bacterium]
MKTDVTLPDEGKPDQPTGQPVAQKSVHLDFSKKEETADSPFQKAKSVEKRLKLFLWGDSGVFKTTIALQFPKPALIDLEGSADLYGDVFDFGVLKATTFEQATNAIEWLSTKRHDFRTVVIDPFTVLWEALQKKWSDLFLLRNKGSKGYRHEFYDMQPKDWMTLKAELKEFIRKLIALDMNVVVTARQKPQYKEGSFMVAMGDTFDGEKSLPYLFDTIVHLYIDENGRHMGKCLKDRSHKLPTEPFELPKEPLEARYNVFESYFGKQALSRKAKPMSMITPELKTKIEKAISQLGLTSEHVEKRLATYGVEALDDLTLKDAETIASKLDAALSKQITGGSNAKN